MANQTILVVSGPSGAGKGTILKHLIDHHQDKFAYSVSYTTRQPRPGEKAGHHYHYVSNEEFDSAVKNHEFFEWEEIHDNRYGTKKKDLDEIFAQGKMPVFEIDVKGVVNLKKIYPAIISVFIEPPSLDILIKRLADRGTESKEVQAMRISRYQDELKYQSNYDHIIINDTVEQAQQGLLQIVDSYS